MKIQIVQRGEDIFLKRYFFGVIPLYWNDYGFNPGWKFKASSMDIKTAEEIVTIIKNKRLSRKVNKEIIVKKINI